MSEENDVIKTPVEFGGVSFGKQTARIGVKILRDKFGIADAETFLCGSRLKVKIAANPRDELPGQNHLFDASETLEAEVDCKHYSAKPDDFSAAFTFNKSSVSAEALTKIGNRPGVILMERVGNAESGGGDDDDDDEIDPDDREFEAGKDKPIGTPALNAAAKLAFKEDVIDPGAPFPIETLQKEALKKLAKQQGKPYDGEGLSELKVGALKEALEVKTVTDLEKVISADDWWHKKVKRLGETGVDAVTTALTFFRSLVGQPVSEADAKIDAYKAGCQANLDCLTLDDNPFPEGSEFNAAWAKGFAETAAQGTAEGEGAEDTGTMFGDGNTTEVDPSELSEVQDPEATE